MQALSFLPQVHGYLYKKLPKYFQKGLYHFTSQAAVYESFQCSTSQQRLVLSVFNFSHSDMCAVVPYWGFNLICMFSD